MRTGRALLLVAVAVTIAALSGAPAYAHADYRDSDPPDGGSVPSPPAEIWAEFTEQPVEGSSLVVADPCGRRVDGGDYRYQPYPINRITVSMSADTAGEYVVTWTVTSNADGHTTRGTFSFVSEDGAPCPSDEGSSGGSDDEGGGSGSARRSTSSEGNSEATGSSETSDAVSSDVQDENRKRSPKAKAERRRKARKASEDKNDGRASITLTQDDSVDLQPREEGSDDIPLDWLVVGLSVSALIGAAGGRIYVNIVAPRR